MKYHYLASLVAVKMRSPRTMAGLEELDRRNKQNYRLRFLRKIGVV